MAKAWQNIAAAEVDAESAFIEALVGKFHSNQEALISVPVDTRFPAASAAAAATVVANIELWIPPAVATLEGAVTLVIRAEGYADVGTVGRLRFKLGAGTPVDSSDLPTGVTAWGFVTVTISSTDVKAVAGTHATLEVTLVRVSGAGTVFGRCLSSSSRLERAA